jgi:hypothetical protein
LVSSPPHRDALVRAPDPDLGAAGLAHPPNTDAGVLPPAVVYGRLITSQSPLSSASRSPTRSPIGRTLLAAGAVGSRFFSGRVLVILE